VKLPVWRLRDEFAGEPPRATLALCKIDRRTGVGLLCARAAGRLTLDDRFPPPKIFTNALLGDHEITTLIRDTEAHERALFSFDPGVKSTHVNGHDVLGRKSGYRNTPPARQSAVTRILGKEMLQEIRAASGHAARSRDGVNVEILLRGAEKLGDVYAVPGVTEKIMALRSRYRDVTTSISLYEAKVSQQESQLDRRNKGSDHEEDTNSPDDDGENTVLGTSNTTTFNEQDFQLEEDIRELEAKKKALEERVSGMEKDLGGLLR